MTGTDHALQAADGVRVRYRRWLPPGEPRGTVQLVHGASEHSGRYGRLATGLTFRGLAVYAMELRRHGRTAADTGAGRFGGGSVAAVLADVRSVHRVMDGEHPGVPRLLLGHSTGSIVALASAEQDGGDLCGLALSGPVGAAPHLAGTVAALQAAVAAGAGDDALDALGAFDQPIEPARAPFDRLSRDPAGVDANLADPLCGDGMPLTVGYAAGVFDLAVRSATPEALAQLPDGLPVLLLSGQRDPAGGAEGAQVTALADLLRARGLPVQQHVYPAARHEVFDETDRDEVVADLLDWLDTRLRDVGGGT